MSSTSLLDNKIDSNHIPFPPSTNNMMIPHNNTNHTDGTMTSLTTVNTSQPPQMSTIHPSPAPQMSGGYQVYSTRWVALALFSSLLLCNALLWVTFSPISDITQHYFDSDPYYGSTTGINMLANVFLILYTPGTFIAVVAMKYLKPRKSLLLAGGLTALGALLRYVATLFAHELSVGGVYWLIFAGQAFGAIAQPMFLNFPPAIASIWFPVDERDISTTIASMSSPIGNAIGSVIPVLFVTESVASSSSSSSSSSSNTTDYDVHGMQDLMLVEFIVCMIPLLLAWCYFQDAPPTPPSHSTQLKLDKAHHHHANPAGTAAAAAAAAAAAGSGGGSGLYPRMSEKSMHTIEAGGGGEAQILSTNASSNNSVDHSSMSSSSSSSLPRRPTSSYESFSHTIPVRVSRTMESEGIAEVMRQPRMSAQLPTEAAAAAIEEDPMDSIKHDLHLLLHNKDYIILFCVFSIGVGFFNSIMTLLNQIVSPYGYSNDDAGTFGAVFIFAGLVGAGIGGYVMEKTKAYRSLLKGGIVMVCSVVVVFLCMLFSNNFWPLTTSMALMGFCILPLLPIMMENCAECTYPVQEELSMGILFTGCNVVGLGFIFALQYLIDLDPFGPPPFTPSNIFFIGVMLVAAFILLFYHGEYKRLNHEGANTHLDEDEDSSDVKNNLLVAHADSASDTESDLKKVLISTSSPVITRRATQGSDDCHMVRVGSQDYMNGNSNNSQLFAQSSSAVETSQNIWMSSNPTTSYSTSQPRTSQAIPPSLQVLVHAARTPSTAGENNNNDNNNNEDNNNLREPLL